MLKFSTEKQSLMSTGLQHDPSQQGISVVKRLFNIKRDRSFQSVTRINKNRGLGSTKTAYSSNYRDY